MEKIPKIESEIRRIRTIQLQINGSLSEGLFMVPVHLGLGHEALAATCVAAMEKNDTILLTHRNIHFQIALGASLEDLENEYLLNPKGLANGKLGSMNLMNPEKGNVYTSNILGNNLAVALGVGLASSMRGSNDVTWVVTGDGAIEEGVFFESLLMSASLGLPVVYLVENNDWSLATRTDQRRISMDLKKLANSVSIDYTYLEGNGVEEYLLNFRRIREQVVTERKPQLVEAKVDSLGGFVADIGQNSERYINYHAGPLRTEPNDEGILANDTSDPVFNLLHGDGDV
jgi:TPP-dependent pyruvate/acetoin dehydrogenase alpha subunit